jgi:hypothetical protein
MPCNNNNNNNNNNNKITGNNVKKPQFFESLKFIVIFPMPFNSKLSLHEHGGG